MMNRNNNSKKLTLGLFVICKNTIKILNILASIGTVCIVVLLGFVVIVNM